MFLCTGETYRGIDKDTVLVDSLSTYFGCDSVVLQRVYLSEWRDEDIHLQLEGCAGDTIQGFTESTFSYDTTRNASQCYVTITAISILEPEFLFESIVLCNGETLEGISQSGVYLDTIKSVNLCDSIIHEKEVEILDQISTTISIKNCEGEIYEDYSDTGNYTDVFVTSSGCDSTRILSLEVHPVKTNHVIAHICQGENHGGYSESGIYTDMFVSVSGCDSIRTLESEVLEMPISEIEYEICMGDEIDGYAQSGEYIDRFVSVNGCDSIRILHLEVRPQRIYIDTVYLCPWERYEELGAPNRITSFHTSSYDCDSLRHIDLLSLDREDPSCAFAYEDDPKLISETDMININPNPATEQMILKVKRAKHLPASLSILNTNKELIAKYSISEELTRVDVTSYPSGIFLAVIRSGNNVFVQKMIKL